MRRQRDSLAALPFKKPRAEMAQDLGLDLRRTGGLPRRLARRKRLLSYAEVSALTSDSAAFAKRMLREIGVAITPGIDFAVRGNRFVRLSYAGPHAATRDAASRIKSWLKG